MLHGTTAENRSLSVMNFMLIIGPSKSTASVSKTTKKALAGQCDLFLEDSNSLPLRK